MNSEQLNEDELVNDNLSEEKIKRNSFEIAKFRLEIVSASLNSLKALVIERDLKDNSKLMDNINDLDRFVALEKDRLAEKLKVYENISESANEITDQQCLFEDLKVLKGKGECL